MAKLKDFVVVLESSSKPEAYNLEWKEFYNIPSVRILHLEKSNWSFCTQIYKLLLETNVW